MGEQLTHEFSLSGVNTGRMTPSMQTTVNMPDSPDLPGSGGPQTVNIPGQPVMRPSFLQAFLANLGPALAGGVQFHPNASGGGSYGGLGGALENIQSVGNQNRQYQLQVQAAQRAQQQEASTLALQAEQLKHLQQMGPLDIQEKQTDLDLKRAQLAFYADPTNLDRAVGEATKSLGQLNPNEQAQIDAAKTQAKITRKIDPIAAAVKDISDGRRTDARAEQTVEKKELNDFIQNPPKGYKGTPTEFLRYKSSITPVLNFRLANTGTTGPVNEVAARFGYTPAAFDAAAEKYFQTGQLPPSGRGGPALATNKAIMNRATELHPGESLAESSAAYKANTKSLENLQKLFDNVNAFESTAIKNLDQVAKAGAQIPDLGARFANVPVRNISANMIGTPEMARFKTALLTAQTESAKILSSANASGVLTNEARMEAQHVLNGDLPFPAMMASINQLKTDFANRHESYQQQINDIKGRIRGKGSSAPASQGGQEIHYKIVNGQLVPQ